MKKFIVGMAVATTALLSFGFTFWTDSPRHPNVTGLDAAGGTSVGRFLVVMASGSTTTPKLAYSTLQMPILDISTGLGAGTLLATGTVYGGAVTTSGFVLTSMSMYVSVASSNTAATQVLTVTDGTNACLFTFACNGNAGVGGGTLTTGVTSISGTDGGGTGCTFAANATLTVSTTTQGCGTAATVKNIIVYGRPTS